MNKQINLYKNCLFSYLKCIISLIPNCGICSLFPFLKNYFVIKKNIRGKLSLIRDKYKIENPSISYQKYLEINYWLFETLRRFYVLGLHKKHKKIKILDIGTGAGYFPFICNFYGYEAEALDVPDNEMYNEIIKELEIKRYVQYIDSFEKIDVHRKYDLISAFMICFNRHGQQDVWHIREWEYFLNSLHDNNLNPGGEMFLSFNAETAEEPVNKELLAYFAANNAEIDGNTVHIKSNYRFIRKSAGL